MFGSEKGTPTLSKIRPALIHSTTMNVSGNQK